MDKAKYRGHCARLFEFLKKGRGGLYIGENTVLCGNVGGQQILSDVRHSRSLQISFKPSPSEIGVLAVLYYLIKGGMVGTEIDAGCGFYSVFLSSLAGPSGKIYSFESIPECYDLLVKNTQMNDIHTITCVNKAVLDRQKKFSQTYFNVNYNFSFSPPEGYSPKQVESESVSLDSFLNDVNEPFLDFAIINNTEDLPLIWEGMTDTLKASLDIKIICKIDAKSLSKGGFSALAFLNQVVKEGFEIFLIPSLRQVSPEDVSVSAMNSIKTVLLSRNGL